MKPGFPLAIYYTDLPDAAAHKDSLLAAVLAVEQTAHERRASDGSAWTGDVHGAEQIHNDERFAWIVEQLEVQTRDYLSNLGIDLDKVDIYIQRAWPVISRKDQSVGAHRHHNANISSVYYVSAPQNGEAGSIIFFNDARMNEVTPGIGTDQTAAYAEWNALNFESVIYPPLEGRLLLFPAKLRHSVGANQTEELRVSLSFDIVLTSAEAGDPGLYEFLSPPPSRWKRFK